MPQVELSVTITTPADIPTDEALRLFGTQNGYNPQNAEALPAFCKRILADRVRQDIVLRRRTEAAENAAYDVPDDIVAE